MVLGRLRRRNSGAASAGSMSGGGAGASASAASSSAGRVAGASLAPGAGGVNLTVLDPFGQTLAGAEVSVTETATRRKAVSGVTDPYGMFFASLPPGTYSVLISSEGLQPHRANLESVPGRVADLGRIALQTAALKELPPPGTWMFDPPHTAIRFVARHVGMANVHGRFTEFQGGILVADRMEDSQVEISIKAASLTTGNKTRDNHLRSADFLDVDRFPYLHFASDRFIFRGGTKWTVAGSFTLHGVTRNVELDTEYLGTVTGGYGEELRCAARATAELHRDDYTLPYREMLARGIAIVGPRIKLELDIQAMYQSPETPTPPE
ncbi:YceI family protein [Phaeacidiphilus oryzae]|uniref:YceI family protein n=1 Tax=Phaeacidiphilus oryzae TaxID=348818 RepID=UPI00056A5D20|nr:YceI family protein [Phaeacidiphilus oryzae]